MTVEVVEVCGVAVMLPQLEPMKTSATPASTRLNWAMSILPRLRQGRHLLVFDLLRCFPSNTDRQSFVRDLPRSS